VPALPGSPVGRGSWKQRKGKGKKQVEVTHRGESLHPAKRAEERGKIMEKKVNLGGNLGGKPACFQMAARDEIIHRKALLVSTDMNEGKLECGEKPTYLSKKKSRSGKRRQRNLKRQKSVGVLYLTNRVIEWGGKIPEKQGRKRECLAFFQWGREGKWGKQRG